MIFWKINMQSVRAAQVSIYNLWYVCARGSTTAPGPLTGTPTSLAANHFSLPGSLMAESGGRRECTLCAFHPHSLSVHCTVYKTQRLLLPK